jgi:hypothetical protein
MKFDFQRETQQQRTKQDTKVEDIRREANEVFYPFFLLFQLKTKILI